MAISNQQSIIILRKRSWNRQPRNGLPVRCLDCRLLYCIPNLLHPQVHPLRLEHNHRAPATPRPLLSLRLLVRVTPSRQIRGKSSKARGGWHIHGSLTESVQTLYIFFGIAALVGIVTGTSLHYVSGFIISILNLDSSIEEQRGRTLASYRAEKQERRDAKDPILKFRQKDEGLQRNDLKLREDYTNWNLSEQDRGRGGNRFNTILEEEDTSDGFWFRGVISEPLGALRRAVTNLHTAPCANASAIWTLGLYFSLTPCCADSRKLRLCGITWNANQSAEEQPRHPQLTHSIAWSSFSCACGTRQMQVALKFVSFVWMHRRQHNCSPSPISAVQESCPGNMYLFIPLLLPFGNQIPVCITIFE